MRAGARIAVIGAGISGLSAAWLLSRRYDVTLFERDRRPGGHSNTVDAAVPNGITPVDTGFIVYNGCSYPNLVALFDHLQVATSRSAMSFSVSLSEGRYEYSGSGLLGIFGQGRNWVDPAHWRLLVDIRRFFKDAQNRHAISEEDTGLTLGQFLLQGGYSTAFVQRHILPMAAAIWSCPPARMLDFPYVAFARFFANHGLLQVRNRPEWRTVVGGSRSYVQSLLRDFAGQVVLEHEVERIDRDERGIAVIDCTGRSARFDSCVLATHADQALRLLAAPDPLERALLSAFRYQSNRAVLHTDASHMPRRRHLWSSWNFIDDEGGTNSAPYVTYWMNRLQPLPSEQDLFVTLNARRPFADGAEIAALEYAHPVFDAHAMDAQRRLWSLQGRHRTWYCGSYFGSGFHEDGLQAGLAAAEDIGGVRRPWSVVGESARIHVTRDPSAEAIREAAE